jgi:hypothetical protein
MDCPKRRSPGFDRGFYVRRPRDRKSPQDRSRVRLPGLPVVLRNAGIVASERRQSRLHRYASTLDAVRLFATFLTKCMRRYASVSAEKACEVRGIGKGEIFGDLVDRMASK